MYEIDKLNEAKYFLLHMEESVDKPDAFQYELSAFLSSARSVLQYALEEVKQKTNGQQWYENQVSGNAILKFFKDKRDINIHAEPVRPTKHISVSDTVHVGISESVKITITREDGSTEVREFSDEPPQTADILKPSSEVRVSYIFNDWAGSENAIELSKLYLAGLKSLVNRGIDSGFISG